MSQINTVFEINGHSFEFDIHDLETAERYENAFERMKKAELDIPKIGKPSDAIRAAHKMFVELFDDVFGENNGVKVVGEKPNSRVCFEAYEKFLVFITEQKQQTTSFTNNVIDKFSLNRAQRRAQDKKNK